MKAFRGVVEVRARTARTVEFGGSPRAVYGAIKETAAVWMRDPKSGVLLVREDHADAVMTELERRNYKILVTL